MARKSKMEKSIKIDWIIILVSSVLLFVFYKTELLGTFWIVVLGIIVLVILAGRQGSRDERKKNLTMKRLGYTLGTEVNVGKYFAGHPMISDSQGITVIFMKNENFEIWCYPYNNIYKMPEKKGEISIDLIKDIVIEDKSLIERRVTILRLLMVGIFAFGWKKKKKDEIAYLVIEWLDNKFSHESIFEFEGKDAFQKANVARNELVKKIN